MNVTLHIQALTQNNKTYLKNTFYTPPFKVADVTEDKKEATLQLMLMSSSPGILDGDEYNIKIEVGEMASVQLHTQSYQRLFTMKKGASQNMEVHLAPGSSFCFIPHPTVPHKASSYKAKNKIFLSNNCNLIWGEILTPGRKLNGEVFQFTKYHNLTEIYVNERLVIKENLLLEPSKTNVTGIGQLEGYTHGATLIFVNETAVVKPLIEEVSEWLALQQDVTFGISALPVNGCIVRILGYKGEQLYNCLKWIAAYLQSKNSNRVANSVNPKLVAYAN